MNVHLLFPDRDFTVDPSHAQRGRDVMDDLGLHKLLQAMAGGNPLLYEVARAVLLSDGPDIAVIRYRQAVLEDALQNPECLRTMFQIAERALVGERHWLFGSFWSQRPSALLHRGIDVMEAFARELMRLKATVDESRHAFRSEGLRTLAAVLDDELSPAFFEHVREHLRLLQFTEGTTVSARLGPGMRPTEFVLRRPAKSRRSWRGLRSSRGPAFTFTINERDESGAQAVAGLYNRGINQVADVLTQATDHVKSFFTRLERELGFYVACLNLCEHLQTAGTVWTLPTPLDHPQSDWRAEGLYDPVLTLAGRGPVVDNDFQMDGHDVLVITGANQGGKSTFLRSIGLAQLMMQAGMVVCARRYEGPAFPRLFTHFRREEDAALERGKLDEELARMSQIVDHLQPGSMVLFNEAFASTNEREGAEVALQILTALVESGIRVLVVTHLYALTRRLQGVPTLHPLFLRAERTEDGRRTFKILPGAPLSTSFGPDLFREVFYQEPRS